MLAAWSGNRTEVAATHPTPTSALWDYSIVPGVKWTMKLVQQEPGQAIVEFALTGLIFLTLLVFILDGSRIFWHCLTVTEAARVCARYAIVHGAHSTGPVGPGNYTALTNQIKSTAVGLDPAALTVTPTWPTGNGSGSSVTVIVTYRVQPITRLFWPDQTFTLSAQSTMVIQN